MTRHVGSWCPASMISMAQRSTSFRLRQDSAIRVLDLGAGTGLLSALIAETFPNAHLTLVDISEGMLDQARQRFVNDAARFQFHALDLAEGPLWGRYEAVVSALAIHHVSDEGKQRLFQGVYDVLCDGGVFINADQVLGMTPEIDEEYKAAWLRQVRERGVDEGDLAAALERMKEDEMSTLSLQMKCLEDARLQDGRLLVQELRLRCVRRPQAQRGLTPCEECARAAQRVLVAPPLQSSR